MARALRVAAATLSLILAAPMVRAADLLPDLTIASTDVSFGPDPTTGRFSIFFATHSSNKGAGPMELRVVAKYVDHEDVNQRVYRSDGTFFERYAGTFVYHPEHHHIHFEDFANYLLREVNEDGTPGSTVAGSEKVSFCLTDSQRIKPKLTKAPKSPQYGGLAYSPCADIQGISRGWTDVYANNLEGQSMDLATVSGGTYWLELTVDPINRLLESNEANNTSRVKVQVPGGLVPQLDILGANIVIPNGDTTSATADGTDFGTITAGGTATHSFTITNNGTGTLSLNGVPKVKVVGTTAFTVVGQPDSPVQPSGGSTTFNIQFNPATPGHYVATISVVTNVSGKNPYTFAVTGDAN